MRYLLVLFILTALCLNCASAKSVELVSAQIYFKQGDFHKAIEFYLKAIEDMEAKIAEAKAQGKQNKNAEKDLSLACFEIGQCYQQLQDYQAMSRFFDKSLAVDDKFLDKILDTREEFWVEFYNAGVPLFNQREYEKALAKFNLAVIIDPTNMQGYRQRGMCYMQMDDFESAILDFRKYLELEALENVPKDLAVRVDLGNIYYIKYNHSREELQAARDKIAAGETVNESQLQDLKKSQNEFFDKTVNFYKESLLIDPENVPIISRIGLMYQEMGDADKAVEMYNQALLKNPTNSDLYFNMGILYFHMDKFDKAIESFNKVVEMNPNDVESIMNLVNSLWKVEMFGQTIPYLERVVALDAKHLQAWSLLSVAYVKEATKEGISETLKKEYLQKAQRANNKYKELSGK